MNVSDSATPNQPRFRSLHRARQHESAHARQQAEQTPHKPIDHPLVAKSAGELIVSDSALKDFIDHLRQQKSFAYDSEFIGELSYHPRLCLIQAATTQRIGLIDPLAGVNLCPFWELLCDPSIEKIVHAGEQDIEPVHRLTGRPAANIFDTQIAAGMAGLAYPVSLGKLIHQLLGVRLGKGMTFTHWDRRPLSALQLRYAADDVRYLLAVRAELGKRLEALGHSDWAAEECRSLCDPARYRFDPDGDYLRIRGAGSLSPQQLSVLRELMIWRDAAARANDLPPRTFLKESILIELARSPVRSVEKLARVKGLPRPVQQAHGQQIIQAIIRGLESAQPQRPDEQTELTPAQRFGADSLFAVASSICAARGIDAALVVSRQEVTELYLALCTDRPLPTLRLLSGWRARVCGDKLLELIRGGQLHLRWRDGRLTADH